MIYFEILYLKKSEKQKYINIKEYEDDIFLIEYDPKKPIKDMKKGIKKAIWNI